MGRAKRDHRRRLLIRMALLAVSVCLSVGVAELVLRTIVCITARSAAPLFRRTVRGTIKAREDPYRSHALIEGVAFVATGAPRGFEFCVFGRISSQGLNDDVVPIEKAAGEKRVLVLGDSFTEAAEVRRHENYCELLEQRLSEELPYPVSVINAGVSAYSPLLEYLYYTRELRKFRADIVLLALSATDVFEDLRYTQAAKFNEQGIPVAVPSRPPPLVLARDGVARDDLATAQLELKQAFHRKPNWAASRLYVAALVDHAWTAWRMRRAFPHPPLQDQFFILEDDPTFAPARRHGWVLTQRYISLLKHACGKKWGKACLDIDSHCSPGLWANHL